MKHLLIISILILSACRGPEGVQGGKGDVGIPGTPGQSIVGPIGPAGMNGLNGQDGTIVTPVKLCSEAPSYPSVFPEYALCLQGILYGVYSTHGGFLAELPNGDYNSHAVGSTCNLHISGCTVTEL